MGRQTCGRVGGQESVNMRINTGKCEDGGGNEQVYEGGWGAKASTKMMIKSENPRVRVEVRKCKGGSGSEQVR